MKRDETGKRLVSFRGAQAQAVVNHLVRGFKLGRVHGKGRRVGVEMWRQGSCVLVWPDGSVSGGKAA